MTNKWREENRDFFAGIESDPKYVDWVKSSPIALDAQKHSIIVEEVQAMCKRAGIEPITLYSAEMPIPHVVCMPNIADKSKFVISNSLLSPPFNEEQVAMYIAHKLGHEFNGIIHALSKVSHEPIPYIGAALAVGAGVKYLKHEGSQPSMLFQSSEDDKPQKLSRRGFLGISATCVLGGILLPKPIQELNNFLRERQADRVAIELYDKPEILYGMLTNMRRWCKMNDKEPEVIYPGITVRIRQAEKLVAQQKTQTDHGSKGI